MRELFEQQVEMLESAHFNLLYWAAMAEDRGVAYNLTNAFDDLKYVNLTRTKQSAMGYIEALKISVFLEIREEGNKKNLYITPYGAQALEMLIKKGFDLQKSHYLGGR